MHRSGHEPSPYDQTSPDRGKFHRPGHRFAASETGHTYLAKPTVTSSLLAATVSIVPLLDDETGKKLDAREVLRVL